MLGALTGSPRNRRKSQERSFTEFNIKPFWLKAWNRPFWQSESESSIYICSGRILRRAIYSNGLGWAERVESDDALMDAVLAWVDAA